MNVVRVAFPDIPGETHEVICCLFRCNEGEHIIPIKSRDFVAVIDDKGEDGASTADLFPCEICRFTMQTSRLGRVLHRPSFVPAPAFALRALFGEGAEPILYGRRAVPKRLAELGFQFAFPTVDAALADSLRG